MTSAKKMYFAIAGGLVALGIVLAGIGFIASGFNPAVFSTQADLRDNTITLGGIEIGDPSDIPFISTLTDIGGVNVPVPDEDITAPR